ncbi:HD-GYP domain-containing protein [Oceanobacillus massiliensis]|uniref:HD-GYP domain-containing protein n=1 Tax=Oceanobacillus massiliensis TaxID=1465765 RepID=UPI000289FCE7|nr:HD-GYP domain-containing protein [Oceanobacillus massiliensis]
MKLASTKSIKPGTILAQSIYNENSVVLLAKGMSLTAKMITRLLDQGITYIYVEDEFTNDIYPESVIPDRLRREATESLKSTFKQIKQEGPLRNSYILNKNEKNLGNIVEQILAEIQNNEKSLTLLSDIFISDDYIFQHSLNVAIYSLAIGVKLNYSRKSLVEIGVGAMLHDVGKIFIDPEILNKPEQLTDNEFEIIKSHTQIGYDYLRKQSDLSAVVAHCAYQHHERLDGSGYPRGISEKDMLPYAKLIGIADVFDAVTSNRIYRDAMLPHEGLEILYAGAMNLFDKEMVEAFKKSIAVYPEGLSLELSDGRQGIVIRQNKELCDRPVLRIVKENGKKLTDTYECNLGKVVNLTVTSVLTD